MTSLPDDDVVESVATGSDGIVAGLDEGKIWADLSTLSPGASRRLAARVRQEGKGAQMLDAPVSGSVPQVKNGTLAIMVGGDADAFKRLEPVLRVLGTPVYVGANGQGLVLKLAINTSLAVQMLAFSEGVLLAEKSGIPRHVAVDVLVHSAVASPMVQYRGPFVLQQPVEDWFDCNMMQKDMLLALEMGRKLDVPLPTTAVSNEFLTAARGMGWEKQDFAVTFDVLARMSGIEH